MHLLSESEVEFFIETNGRLSAQRALALGSLFVSFVEAQESLGDIETIEIVHLGRGSFRARLMVILRDPATATLTAMGALALVGIDLLQKDSDHQFVTEIAAACIESGASRCGFRTVDKEFLVERENIPAIAKAQLVEANASDKVKIHSGTNTGKTSGELSVQGYSPPIFQVEGIFDIDDGQPQVRTIDREYHLVNTGDELPPNDRLASFNLKGPSRQYGVEYALEGWEIKGHSDAIILTGRMVERHGGRAVSFETTDRTFSPIVPDDTLDWVPMGALVEVKALVSEDDPSTLAIFSWWELEEPKTAGDLSHESDRVQPSVEFVHGDAAPLNSEELSADRKTEQYSGMLSSGSNGLEFRKFDGASVLIDGFNHGLSVPDETPIEVDATLRRGSRGGIGDPRLIIWSWRPIDDIQRLSGRVFTGISEYLFHTDGGKRLRIVGLSRGELPTAEHLLVFARFLDAPHDEMAEDSIEILDWRRIDE